MPTRRTTALAVLAILLAVPAAAQPAFDADTVRAGRLDGGKMWLFEAPPYEYLQETYGFRPDSNWFRHARLASLRLPGCSASFVSPNGLVATNHHCVQGYLVDIAREGESLLDDGFASATAADERPIPGVFVDQLDTIADVTSDVEALMADGTTEADAMEQVEHRLLAARGVAPDAEQPPVVVQIARLYDGARYSAYTFHRYHDVRLVFAPETQLGFFGGDADNFTYPRYALDFSLLRIYDDGRPMESPVYFRLSDDGIDAGELVFVIGNPGSTSRSLTRAGLELQRDLNVPITLQALRERTRVLRQYIATDPEDVDEARAQVFGLSNSEKVYVGRQSALNDPYIVARRAAAERALVTARPEARPLVDSLALLADARRRDLPAFRAFALLYNGGLGSAVLRRARAAVMMEGLEGAELEEARTRFSRIGDRPAPVERGYLAAELEGLRTFYSQGGRTLPASLAGASADELAGRVLAGSALATSATAGAALDARGTLADDPAIAIVRAISDDFAAFDATRQRLNALEASLTRRLGRVRYAEYGTTIPPDATFSLRFSDGVVRGYPYNGTQAPPFTTFYGMFDRHASFPAPSAWTLPERWVAARDRIDMSTPVNFASTTDTIGGNSGSPVLNRDLELVGLNFDRTIEGLVRDYIYLPDRGRNVIVDARAIMESLRSVYGQDAIADELQGGAMRR